MPAFFAKLRCVLRRALERSRPGGKSALRPALVEHLDRLLHEEIAAIEAYRRTLDHSCDLPATSERLPALTRIMFEHEEAAEHLQEAILRAGGVECSRPQAGSRRILTFMKTCRVNISRSAPLNALKRDEQDGIEQYSLALHERTPLLGRGEP